MSSTFDMNDLGVARTRRDFLSCGDSLATIVPFTETNPIGPLFTDLNFAVFEDHTEVFHGSLLFSSLEIDAEKFGPGGQACHIEHDVSHLEQELGYLEETPLENTRRARELDVVPVADDTAAAFATNKPKDMAYLTRRATPGFPAKRRASTDAGFGAGGRCSPIIIATASRRSQLPPRRRSALLSPLSPTFAAF
ncbi:hypothetical protein BD626DRAFT_131534 [Schizophyllum amplum]|uniref:Uncharacterized protein n=1 Tax=Schizophyllum amplum TaxID=97359 RepID=A0A550C6E5_9AGAR|nr:hypothetical protein BD626DRAFT_131534 [Auriculariopsis ampla]